MLECKHFFFITNEIFSSQTSLFSYTETKTFDILKKYFCPQDYYFLFIYLFLLKTDLTVLE